MSPVRTKHLKLVVGAAGAAALTVGAIAAPALAAPHDLTYTCTTLGPTAVTFNPGKLKSTMVAGQTDKHAMSQTIHLNDGQGALAASFGTSVSGKLTAGGAKSTMPFSMTIPSTDLNGGAQDIPAAGTGTIRPTKAGKFKVSLGQMSAALVVSGGPGGDIPVTDSCAGPTDGTQTLGTITVSKDKSTTTTRASYNARKDVATATAKVKGAKFGLAGTGKVSFTLKKGTHTVKTVAGTLKKGAATASFKNVKAKGTYSITTSFKGDAGLGRSSGKDTFTVR